MRRSMCGGVLLLALTGLAACNAVGPRTIPNARFNYNEAIVRSWDEQLLLNLVRLQYRDTPLLLEITDITTSYSMAYNAGISDSVSDVKEMTRMLSRTAGAAAQRSFERVDKDTDSRGLSLGLSYQEEPTITYAPLQGRKFAQQLLKPIQPESILLLSQSGWSIERVLRLCVQEMNGVYNAPSASGPTPDYTPRYEKFAEVAKALRQLQIGRAVEIIAIQDGTSEQEIAVSLRFRLSASTIGSIKKIDALLGLGLNLPLLESTDLAKWDKYMEVPVVQAPYSPRREKADSPRIHITTRSLLGVMHYLSQSVEAPKRHRDRGLVTSTSGGDDADTPFDWKKVTGDLMQIHSQEFMPGRAFVGVRYRGTWFYIDDADLESKSTFSLLSNLVSLQAMEISDKAAPIKTIAIR